MAQVRAKRRASLMAGALRHNYFHSVMSQRKEW